MNASAHEHRTSGEQAQLRVALYTSGYLSSSLERQEAALRIFLTTHQPQWRVVTHCRDLAGQWRATAAGQVTVRPGPAHLLAKLAEARGVPVLQPHRHWLNLWTTDTKRGGSGDG